MLKSYLRHRSFLFLWTGIVLAIYAFLQYLYWYPLDSIGYTALIVLTLLTLISALDYRRYQRRQRQLEALEEAWISLEKERPETRDPLELRYQQPVSYTHLDVYKRQAAPVPAPASSRPRKKPLPRRWPKVVPRQRRSRISIRRQPNPQSRKRSTSTS